MDNEVQETKTRKRVEKVEILGQKVPVEQSKEVQLAIHLLCIDTFHIGHTKKVLTQLGVKFDKDIKTNKVGSAFIEIQNLWVKQGGNPNTKKSSCCG